MADLEGSRPVVLSADAEDITDKEYTKPADELAPLAAWVVEKYGEWRQWRINNYGESWDAYERLWRGQWSSAEQLRASERSRIVSPALSEAVENGAAEIEEATFGRGDYFDLKPSAVAVAATAEGALDVVRASLKEDLGLTDFAANASECILNSAVYGTGIGEIVVKEIEVKAPIVDPVSGLRVADTVKMPVAVLRSVNPRNFLIDPNAKTIEEALGVAVEEYVGKHIVEEAQLSKVFRDVDVCEEAGTDDDELKKDKLGESTEYTQGRVHQIRYYGKVPKRLLFPSTDKEVTVELFDKEQEAHEGPEEMVEAIVVIGNKKAVLKAEENPYMMKDRPIVAFPWDVIPGKFYGRGLCEKGFNSQKILDAEIRARLDSLALTTIPMVGIDGTRMPRGFKFEVAPGKSIITTGNPNEILHPFKLGQLDPNHWQNSAALQQMVQQATGSVNGAGMAQAGGEARTGAMSMAMAPIIKRYKRTMINFVDRFLMPAIEKITYRNMQYQPNRYPAVGVQFVPASTMGIMQREYETSQLTSLLATMPPGSPEHRAILAGIVSNTSIPNRDKVIALINAAEQREAALAQQQMMMMQQQGADPMMAELQMTNIQLEIAEKQARIQELQTQAALNAAKARNEGMKPQWEAAQIATKGIYSVAEDRQAAEFDRRMKAAKVMLDNRALDIKERTANQQFAMGMQNERTKQIKEMERKVVPMPVPVRF